jgi:putative SOS response-associated peptidase YedK
MCYSAQIEASFKEHRRRFGAMFSFEAYVERVRDLRFRLPRALEFEMAALPGAAALHEALAERRRAEVGEAERLLFSQRTRLVEAERQLARKPTKAAQESARIAGNKIAWASERLQDLRRVEPLPQDARIYPGWYCPVLVVDEGQLRVQLMRYQCRPAGKPADFDQRFPGTYNARRDKLQRFWRPQFGLQHGILLAHAFYEHVRDADGASRILEFRPQGWQQPLLAACLWSRWTAPGEPPLLSFAAITDEPPPEVAAAGHDRCIVPLKEANLEAWLNPQGRGDAALFALLDDRERPYYEHRLAA